MKLIYKILIASLFFFTSITNAQEDNIVTLGGNVFPDLNQTPLYFKDTENKMDKFLGTWEFNDGTNYLKITFIKKERVESSPTSFFDELVCEYQFKINDVEKYNTYGANSTIDERGSNGILGSSFLSDNKIELVYFEPPLNGCERYKNGMLTLEYINNTPNQLIWTRVNSQVFGWKTTCGYGGTKDMSDQIIPKNLTLTKVD